MTGKNITTVDFHGTTLIAQKGVTPADTMIAMKPVVDGVGLDWSYQYRKIISHPVLSKGVAVIAIPSEGGLQEMISVPLNRLNFWLATIHPNRIKDKDIRARVIEYQTECADALFEYFFGKAMGGPLDRQTNGMTKMVAHKVTVVEQEVGSIGTAVLSIAREVEAQGQVIRLMAQALEEQDARVNGLSDAVRGLIVAADPRVAAIENISPLDVAKRYGVEPMRRRTFCKTVSDQMDRISKNWNIPVPKSRETGKRLFALPVVDFWLNNGGRAFISSWKANIAGQTVLPFPKRRRSRSYNRAA